MLHAWHCLGWGVLVDLHSRCPFLVRIFRRKAGLQGNNVSDPMPAVGHTECESIFKVKTWETIWGLVWFLPLGMDKLPFSSRTCCCFSQWASLPLSSACISTIQSENAWQSIRNENCTQAKKLKFLSKMHLWTSNYILRVCRKWNLEGDFRLLK